MRKGSSPRLCLECLLGAVGLVADLAEVDQSSATDDSRRHASLHAVPRHHAFLLFGVAFLGILPIPLALCALLHGLMGAVCLIVMVGFA